MTATHAQTWKSSSFSVERKQGKARGTVIFCLSGPFTARDMYSSLTPDSLRSIFDLQSGPDGAPPALNIALNILDLTDVPYMDSTGLGAVVSHYVHCCGKGVRMVAAGASPRVLELFRITKVDGIIPMTASVAEADTP